MGNSESTTSIYVCLSELNNYKCKEDEVGAIGELHELLRVSEHQTISPHQVKLHKTSDVYYTVKTHTPVDSLTEYEGCATITNKDDLRLYEGVVKRGKKEQYGKQYNSKGELVYEGQYLNDWYEGWGKTKHYQGQYFKGQRHGWGIYKDPEHKVTYEGMFEQGLFQGIGFLNVPQDQVRDYMQQNLFLSDPTIDVKYVGEWSQGKLTGRGKLVTRTDMYSGQFKKCQLEGEGKLVEKSGKVSQGKFYMGMHI